MARKRKPPAYLANKSGSGKKLARCVIRWPGGKVETKSLGDYGSPESYAEHARWVAEWRQAWQVDPAGTPRAVAGPVLTVDDLIARYWVAQQELRGNSPELTNIAAALRPVQRLYGRTQLREFGPRALKAVVRAMADGSWMNDEDKAKWAQRGKRTDGWCRRFLNRNLGRVKACWKWAESEELVAAGVYQSLLTVPGVSADTPGVRVTADILPIPEDRLQAILEQLAPIPRTMVQVQLLTGMRPGELLRLTPGSLSRGDQVEIAPGHALATRGLWAWLPAKHKTAGKKKKRLILFGRQAQELLTPFLFGPADQRIFKYGRSSYNQAFGRACERAFPGEPTYHVHQCRHNAATRLVQQFGWEVAKIILGHSDVRTTAIYALENFQAAVDAVCERAS